MYEASLVDQQAMKELMKFWRQLGHQNLLELLTEHAGYVSSIQGLSKSFCICTISEATRAKPRQARCDIEPATSVSAKTRT